MNRYNEIRIKAGEYFWSGFFMGWIVCFYILAGLGIASYWFYA